jgi:hypothetical protein
MRVRDFVADLARAGKGFTEIKKTVEAAYGTGARVLLKFTELLSSQGPEENTGDQCHLNPKKTICTANLIASVAATVADDRQIDTRSLAAAHGVCLRTIWNSQGRFGSGEEVGALDAQTAV